MFKWMLYQVYRASYLTLKISQEGNSLRVRCSFLFYARPNFLQFSIKLVFLIVSYESLQAGELSKSLTCFIHQSFQALKKNPMQKCNKLSSLVACRDWPQNSRKSRWYLWLNAHFNSWNKHEYCARNSVGLNSSLVYFYTLIFFHNSSILQMLVQSYAYVCTILSVLELTDRWLSCPCLPSSSAHFQVDIKRLPLFVFQHYGFVKDTRKAD